MGQLVWRAGTVTDPGSGCPGDETSFKHALSASGLVSLLKNSLGLIRLGLKYQRRPGVLAIFILLVMLLAACAERTAVPVTESNLASPTPRSSRIVPSPAVPTQTLTQSAIPTQTSSLSPTSTASLTPTITPTPPELPVFTTRILRPGVLPQTYIPEVCTYLERRWAKDASPPGTVVVPVMLHSIVKSGRVVTDPKDISVEEFQGFVQYANFLGFRTITTAQLTAFLHQNMQIPPRSMILILDDRRPGVVRDHFLPVLKANDWTLTLAYIADPDSMAWAMDEVQRLAEESGRLDVQSHGYSGQLYILDDTPVERIQAEIWDSTPVLEHFFGERPTAFIWPGGNFSVNSVQIARDGGYQLGFTAYSRGPVLYNWIPQGELELAVNDPLMLLPRAWSNSVNVNLNEAVSVAEESTAFARENYAQEASYFRVYCGGELAPLESILPQPNP